MKWAVKRDSLQNARQSHEDGTLPARGFPILPRRPIILHHRLWSRFSRSRESDLLTFVAFSGAAFNTNPKQIQPEDILCSLNLKSRNLDTTTPRFCGYWDCRNQRLIRAELLASEVSNDEIDNAQWLNRTLKDSDTPDDSTAKETRKNAQKDQ